MLSIFSCASWPSVCLLWRNICLGLPPIFLLGCLFFLILSWMSCLYILEINPLLLLFLMYKYFRFTLKGKRAPSHWTLNTVQQRDGCDKSGALGRWFLHAGLQGVSTSFWEINPWGILWSVSYIFPQFQNCYGSIDRCF